MFTDDFGNSHGFESPPNLNKQPHRVLVLGGLCAQLAPCLALLPPYATRTFYSINSFILDGELHLQTKQPDNVPSPALKPPIPPESALKETYLQLLPHPVLVSLVLALDRNHDAVIWPSDLPSAIDSLREYAKRLYAPSKTPIAPIAPAALPPSVGPHNGPNRQGHPAPLPVIPPIARHLPTQIVPRIPGPPQPTPVPTYGSSYTNSGYATSAPVRVPPHRNQTGRPPNGPGSGGMPSYEEMIAAALEELQEPDGLAPKTVFDYMGT